MALEAPPASGAIWFDNWILQSTIAAYISQRSGYPVRNLLTPHRSDSYQTVNASAGQRVVFDLGSPKLPTCFGLSDVNFDAPGAYVHLYGASDSGLTTSPVVWTMPLYAQDVVGRFLRWYPGTTPSGGTIGPKQFWSVWLVPSSLGPYNPYELTDPTRPAVDYFEIGNVWLGEYTNFVPQEGVRPRPRDPSNRTYAYGGALWTDPLRPYREVDFTIANLDREDLYDLEALIRRQGASPAVLDLHANATDARLKRGGCLYGVFDSTPADAQLDSPDENSLRIRFEEARG